MLKAAASGDDAKVSTLIKANKRLVFARDNQGRTALHLAAMHGYPKVVRSILAEDAEYTKLQDSVSVVQVYFITVSFGRISLAIHNGKETYHGLHLVFKECAPLRREVQE